MTKYYKFFGGYLDLQERWLNKMAANGFRLIDVGKLKYEFTKSNPSEYQYKVDFIGHSSYKEAKNYKEFLEELDYKVFSKNINLNWSFGKIKVRPFGKGVGKISTNPGTYNKELLIVEKKNDGKPFILHSTNEDKAIYYKDIRNAWLGILFLPVLLFIFDFSGIKIQSFNFIHLIAIMAAILIPVNHFQKKFVKYSKLAKYEE